MTPILTRRAALRLASAGVGVAAAPGLAGARAAQPPARAEGQPMPGGVSLPEAPLPAPRGGSVGVAVVGLGGYALRQMLPAFSEASGAHVAALVSGNRQKALTVARAYGVPEDAVYGYDDFGRVASDDRVRAVYVVLPSGLHAEWTERAFAAGKHVLCEKPMALSADECERMIRAGEAAGRRLMIAYRCHFEPVNLEATRLMREGAAGPLRVLRTDMHYDVARATPAGNWRLNRALAGGGPLEDYGLYGLQAAMYLTGEVPVSVTARTFRPEDDPRFTEIFARVTAALRFPSGAVAQVATAYDSFARNAVEAHGRDGILSMGPATRYEGITASLRTREGRRAVEAGASRVQFAAMLDHFAEAVRTEGPIRTPGEMGLRDARVMDAIYRAARSGRSERVRP